MYAIPQELVTLVSHRGTDKYFLLQYPFTASKLPVFHVFIYDMHIEPIDVYVVMNLRRWNWIPNQYQLFWRCWNSLLPMYE